jgi:hypothetical protein
MSEEPGSRSVKRAPAVAKPRASRAIKNPTTKRTGAAPPPETVPAISPAGDSAPSEAGVMPVSDRSSRIEATTVHITQGGAGEVEAETITVTQGGIGAASAEDITVTQGGIGRAQADDIAVRLGFVGIAQGERVSAELSGLGLAIAGEVAMTQSMARTILARDVNIHQGGAVALVAREVNIEGPSGAFLLLAQKVNGNVRTIVDWRGALVIGAGLVAAAGLLRLRRKH